MNAISNEINGLRAVPTAEMTSVEGGFGFLEAVIGDLVINTIKEGLNGDLYKFVKAKADEKRGQKQ